MCKRIVPDIATGCSLNVWMVSDAYGCKFPEYRANKIGRITPSGVITEFAIPTANSGPVGITAGNGSLWFTELLGNKIGRITP